MLIFTNVISHGDEHIAHVAVSNLIEYLFCMAFAYNQSRTSKQAEVMAHECL